MDAAIAGPGSNRSSGSTSGAAILAAFIPAVVTAIVYLSVFTVIRKYFRKFYVPRTFLGTIPEKERTPPSSTGGLSWLYDLWSFPDSFVLRHNSLDAYLWLRFLKFVVLACFIGVCITWPILLPVNSKGGGTASQLDRISFSNIANNDLLWAHVVVSWVFFTGLGLLITRERLQLVGIRQAYLLEPTRAARLSSRTVLFLNAPPEACEPERLEEYFGEEAEKAWPVVDTGDLEDICSARSGAVSDLEKAEMDLIIASVKHHKRQSDGSNTNGVDSANGVPKSRRPFKRNPPLIGTKYDPIENARDKINALADKIEKVRAAPSRNVLHRGAIFVAFSTQSAAHRAYQQITFAPRIPTEDRFLNIQPKEVLWKNLAMPVSVRLSKASLGLTFVIVFTIFFSIPVGLIGTISNAKYLANRFEWLSWINDLPPSVLGLLTGLVPPFLTSWFVSYVPKLFRHIAKLSGEPTLPQAELKTQAWNFTFQVIQVFLITTFSSGAAAVAAQIAQDPSQAPTLLAESLPKASNYYLTYFVLQGLGSASSTIVNYSDLLEYLFYEYFLDKSPREKFQTYAQMKGTPWASWYPKFTNFFVIAIAYSCVAPMVLGFATAGIFLYYLAYRHQLYFACQMKCDTRGEAYKRALQQMATGVYLAEICLIGLFSARKATVPTILTIVLLILTALTNAAVDRILKPLDKYLGLDIWEQQESQIAEEDGYDTSDQAALHAASHGRRLGLKHLPHPAPKMLSDLFDSIISSARARTESAMGNSPWHDDSRSSLSAAEIDKAYTCPALTSKTPKVWIPSDELGVSKQEIEANEAEGLTTTDEGAEIDESGKLHWDHRFENVPIWSAPKVV